MRKKIRKLFAIILIMALGIFIALFFRSAHEYYVEREKNEELRNEAVKKKREKDKEFLTIDFDKLKKINEDIVGWIYIPGTSISYPILYGSKYEHLDYKGNYSICGSIFLTDDEVKNLTDQNPILYGHHMRDGSMFGTLYRFKDKEFGKKHQEIQIYTSEKITVYSLYSVCQTDKYGEEYQSKFESNKLFQKYVEKMKRKSLYLSGEKTEQTESLVTLSTCDGMQGTSRRLIVQGSEIYEYLSEG